MRLPDKAPHKLTEGQWGNNVSWEFYLSDEMPDQELCTAVFCLAVLTKNPERVVLARNKRGWEMLGGHLEPGEDLEQAAHREALEEGGFYVSRLRSFGYRKVIARAPIVNDHHGVTILRWDIFHTILLQPIENSLARQEKRFLRLKYLELNRFPRLMNLKRL